MGSVLDTENQSYAKLMIQLLYQGQWVLFSIILAALLVSLSFHEFGHAWVAKRCGDNTAQRAGRLTLNPISHIDPMGLMMVVFVGFGYAKPVPINFWNFKHWRRDTILVASAGPMSNLILAFLSAFVFYIVPFFPEVIWPWLRVTIYSSITINLILFVFNMLPLLPLDGGRVAVAILPRQLGQLFARLERAGIVIIIIALFLLPWLGSQLGLDFDVFNWLVLQPAQYLMIFITLVVGI